MGKPLPKFVPKPRIWNQFQVCCRLGMSEDRFRGLRDWFSANGFPLRDEDLGGWDANAIEIWLDMRAGLKKHLPEPAVGEIGNWDPSR